MFIKSVFLFCFLLFIPLFVWAKEDIVAGKAKSAICTACHGQAGISSSSLYPNLAGQKKKYLIKQLKAFKQGDRKEPTMSAMAKPLTKQDIKNLAAYYSSLKACK